MPKYNCKPWNNVTCFSSKFQVSVSERLPSMPYAQCGFIHVMPAIENHTVKIFVSYITPVFAVIDDEYIIRLWDGKTTTTSRQISKALRYIYHSSTVGQWIYHQCAFENGSGSAINLIDGSVIDVPACIEDFLEDFSPDYTKISD